ncbi:MAG: hypothetical protein ISR69_01945 [Gammaproteobacteria bacterium]|nr:hypothetical protein [Gammaproteobacteria bacterium]
MNSKINIKEDNKITVHYYLEGGCLGPKGEFLIDDFCKFLEKKLNQKEVPFCHWVTHSKNDIHLHHFQYEIQKRKLDQPKIIKYLQLLGVEIDDFENEIDEFVVHLIEVYLKRHPEIN